MVLRVDEATKSSLIAKLKAAEWTIVRETTKPRGPKKLILELAVRKLLGTVTEADYQLLASLNHYMMQPSRFAPVAQRAGCLMMVFLVFAGLVAVLIWLF